VTSFYRHSVRRLSPSSLDKFLETTLLAPFPPALRYHQMSGDDVLEPQPLRIDHLMRTYPLVLDTKVPVVFDWMTSSYIDVSDQGMGGSEYGTHIIHVSLAYQLCIVDISALYCSCKIKFRGYNTMYDVA